jgi:type IV pilus assembly protein PilN
MIRINLLPIRQTRKRESVQNQLVIFALSILVTGGICFGWYSFAAKSTRDLQAQIGTKKEDLKRLEKIIGEVNQHTKRKKEYEEKLAVIRKLKKSKTGPVRALDDLASELPKRVWLSKMDETSGEVSFTGNALNNEDVSAFMKALEKSRYFNNVVLVSTSISKQGYEFEITCTVNYSA